MSLHFRLPDTCVWLFKDSSLPNSRSFLPFYLMGTSLTSLVVRPVFWPQLEGYNTERRGINNIAQTKHDQEQGSRETESAQSNKDRSKHSDTPAQSTMLEAGEVPGNAVPRLLQAGWHSIMRLPLQSSGGTRRCGGEYGMATLTGLFGGGRAAHQLAKRGASMKSM